MQLTLDLTAVLAQNGVTPVPSTPDPNVAAIVGSLRPRSIDTELIRIGGRGDGGYLLPNDFDGIVACMSPGVADVATFEEQLAHLGIRSHMADASVEGPPIQNELFSFEKRFLGHRNEGVYTRLEDWVKRAEPSADGDLLLQMDIEGSEYGVLLDTPSYVLRRFRMMAIEFHALEWLFARPGFMLIQQVFEKLLRDFTVVHIHPNNCCPVTSRGGVDIPSVMEFTFYRNDRVKAGADQLRYPHPLDSANVPEKEDIVLPDCWWRPSGA